MKKDNFAELNEIRKMLDKQQQLTLESFIMPEEDTSYTEEVQADETVTPQGDAEELPKEEKQKDDSINVIGIEKELTQIRRIALSVINRLADRPTSEDYNTMKRIWNLVDRAIENTTNNENV